jgi:transaldolase
MKFFIDTANLDEIKAASEMGVLDGVTTNPSLIAREGAKLEDQIARISEIVDGPVNAEVLGMTAEEMIPEGRQLAKIHPNVVVKIPMTEEGMKAVKVFSSEGIHTNVTLIFSASQAILCAKAGASYISPFVGRLDDISTPGMELIEQIVAIYDNYAFDTEVLVASVRSPMHVVDSALAGADICTIPFNVIKQLAKHPLTDAGIAKFLADAGK